MVQKTPQSHPEYSALAKTLERLQQVANDVNEFSRKKDSANKIFSLSERLMGFEENLSSPGRILEIEYESLDVSAPFTADKREPMFMALFSDFIMLAKPKKKKLLFKHKVALAPVAWTELPAVGEQWPLTIFDACNTMGIEITVYMENKAEREHFVKALEALSRVERERALNNPTPVAAPAVAAAITVSAGSVSNSPLKQSGALAKLMGMATGKPRGRANSASDSIGANPAASEPILATAPRENSMGGLKASSDIVEPPEESRHALTDLGISSRRRGSIEETPSSRPSLKRTNSLLIGSTADSGKTAATGADRWSNALAASGGSVPASRPAQPRPPVAPINSSKANRRKSVPREMNLIPETARELVTEEEDSEAPGTTRQNLSEASKPAASGHGRKKSIGGSVDEDFLKMMLMDKLNPYVNGAEKETKLTREDRKRNRLSQSIGSSGDDPSPAPTRDQSISSYDSETDVVGAADNREKSMESLQAEEIRRLRRENRKLREKLQQAESTVWTMSESLRSIENSMKVTKALWNFAPTD
jgi:hypothetical protein